MNRIIVFVAVWLVAAGIERAFAQNPAETGFTIAAERAGPFRVGITVDELYHIIDPERISLVDLFTGT